MTTITIAAISQAQTVPNATTMRMGFTSCIGGCLEHGVISISFDQLCL
jgi:hypothetical protein